MKPKAKSKESQVHHKCNKGSFSEFNHTAGKGTLLISLIHNPMTTENQLNGNEKPIFT